MKLECKLIEKSFTDKNTGDNRTYHALQFSLYDGSTLDLPIKGDKARLLQLSERIANFGNSNNLIDKDIWDSNTLPELE